MAPANRGASPVLNCCCAQDDLEPVLRRFAEASGAGRVALRYRDDRESNRIAEGVTATLIDRVGGGETNRSGRNT